MKYTVFIPVCRQYFYDVEAADEAAAIQEAWDRYEKSEESWMSDEEAVDDPQIVRN